MRTWLPAILVAFLAVTEVRGDRVVLVAGGGEKGEGALASESRLNSPLGVDFDGHGNPSFVEIDAHRVCRLDPKGILTRMAGTGQKGSGGDGGQPINAEFNALHNLTIAKNGDIYLADTLNSRVRKIDAKSGRISTVAGSEKGYGGDGGPATQAKFSGIYCATLDPAGERLYLADLDNRRIRVVELRTGMVSTVAGTGDRGVPTDGAQAAKSPLVDPRAVTVDRAGNVFVLERSGNALRVVDPQGAI